jgi:hypothetical protein
VGRGDDIPDWDGRQPVIVSGAKDRDVRFFDLPIPTISTDSRRHEVRLNGSSTLVNLEGMPHRASKNEREDDLREQWILWQVQRYLELGHLKGSSQQFDGLEASTTRGVARRSWRTIERHWSQGGGEEATLSLIVRLATDRALIQALEAISRSPRRMLQRRHQEQKLGRIQELDSTTLRDYARRPGRSAAQKGGARQVLLAVMRCDTVDLVENRLTKWSLKRISSMSDAYCRMHAVFRESERFQSVRRLGRIAKRILVKDVFQHVAPLPHHLSQPTYCLQFETRYRHVWRAYQLIRRHQRIMDDAWRWHFHLWSSSAKLLLGCLLRGMEDWNEVRESTPYIRQEGTRGEWITGPSTPGPFSTPRGLCHVIDLANLNSHSDLVKHLGIPPPAIDCGADWLLVWPKRQAILPVWASVAPSSGFPIGEGLGALNSRLRDLELSSGAMFRGLLFIAEPDLKPEGSDWLESMQSVSILRVPAEVHRCWEDLQVGFQLVLEDMGVC